MEQLADKVMSALASVKHIPRERISLESSLEDLGFDSLDKVTLLFELEKQLELSIPDEEARSLRRVRDIVEGISRLVASASPGSATPEDKQ
ncbi:MAG: acyl carrier protein [Acidobacteria bacterium]|nr:acyl carrier protein [Acidobacteriota bacterium]